MVMASGVFSNFAAMLASGVLFSIRVFSSFSSCMVQRLPRVIFVVSPFFAGGWFGVVLQVPFKLFLVWVVCCRGE